MKAVEADGPNWNPGSARELCVLGKLRTTEVLASSSVKQE